MKDKKRVGGEEKKKNLTLFCLIAAGEQTVQNVEFWARAFQSKAEIVWKDKRTLLFLPLPAELDIAVGSPLWLTEMWKGPFFGLLWSLPALSPSLMCKIAKAVDSPYFPTPSNHKRVMGQRVGGVSLSTPPGIVEYWS